jgi:hypothetical protein
VNSDHDAIVNSLRRTQMLIDTLREELAGVVSFENTIACIRSGLVRLIVYSMSGAQSRFDIVQIVLV